jgi:DeoR family ulaG and ulaABCDEF operon transcriptional repressor
MMQTDVILLRAEQRLIARAGNIVLMVDSSKFKSTPGQVVCELKAISTVITDEGITAADARMINNAGCKLVVVVAN